MPGVGTCIIFLTCSRVLGSSCSANTFLLADGQRQGEDRAVCGEDGRVEEKQQQQNPELRLSAQKLAVGSGIPFGRRACQCRWHLLVT